MIHSINQSTIQSTNQPSIQSIQTLQSIPPIPYRPQNSQKPPKTRKMGPKGGPKKGLFWPLAKKTHLGPKSGLVEPFFHHFSPFFTRNPLIFTKKTSFQKKNSIQNPFQTQFHTQFEEKMYCQTKKIHSNQSKSSKIPFSIEILTFIRLFKRITKNSKNGQKRALFLPVIPHSIPFYILPPIPYQIHQILPIVHPYSFGTRIRTYCTPYCTHICTGLYTIPPFGTPYGMNCTQYCTGLYTIPQSGTPIVQDCTQPCTGYCTVHPVQPPPKPSP